jgi:hypothetical protein
MERPWHLSTRDLVCARCVLRTSHSVLGRVTPAEGVPSSQMAGRSAHDPEYDALIEPALEAFDASEYGHFSHALFEQPRANEHHGVGGVIKEQQVWP